MSDKVSSSSSIFINKHKKSLLSNEALIQLNAIVNYGCEDGYLNLSSKNIDDSMMPELCEWLAKLEGKLVTLILHSNRITSHGAATLFDALRSTDSSLSVVDLSSNQVIDDECMISLGEYIKSNKSIQKINVSYTQISDTGIEIIAPYLNGNVTFKCLFLFGNHKLTEKSIPLLMKMIEISSIEDIRLDHSPITLSTALITPSACNIIKYGSKKLDFSTRGVNDEVLIGICECMKKYGIDKLQEINLERNAITPKGASALLTTLKECNSIVSLLSLSRNKLDFETIRLLGEFLQDNEYLEKLRISQCKITDKDVEVLSECLEGNNALRELKLPLNREITDASLPYFIEIAKKTSITTINVWDTSISSQNARIIADLIKVPMDQREIPIKSNTKSAAKISASTRAKHDQT